MPLFVEYTSAEKEAAKIKNTINMLRTQLVRAYMTNFDSVWRPKPDIATADVLAAFGKDALELFAASAALRDFIESITPGAIPEGYRTALQEVTVHEDGSITLAGE